MKLTRPDNYQPREQWSPSGLKLASQCEMAWFKRYVEGWREADLPPWEEVEHLKRPAKAKKGASPAEQAAAREAIKEYNRITRRALGHAIHDLLARYFRGEKGLDWHGRLGRRAVVALDLLPEPSPEALIEEPLRMRWGPDADPLIVEGFADLLTVRLDDYKTTYSWEYVPTARELLDDIPANFYALAAMVNRGTDTMQCSWDYIRTDEELEPAAQAVTFEITRDHAIEVLVPVERMALHLREIMRGKAKPKHDPTSCDDYNGCVYHYTRGGDCKPPKPATSALIKKQDLLRQVLEERRAAQRNHETTKAKNMGKFAQARTAAAQAPVEETETEETQDAETQPETPAPRQTAPRGRPRKSADDAPAIYLSTDGGILIPAGTALHKRALAVLEAVYAD